MLRKISIVLLLALAVCGFFGEPAFSDEGHNAAEVNVTGTWKGVNYTSEVPGPHVVVLKLTQVGDSVTGRYCAATGVCGRGTGKVSGSKMVMEWENVTSCTGHYTNVYLVTDDQMVWKFQGEDCLGPEVGHGYALKE